MKWLVPVVVAVAVVIVIGALAATGVLKLGGGSGSGSSSSRSYPVTFTESGLQAGTSWTVTLNGATQSSASGSVTFSKTNGTYSYSIGAISGYTASQSSGSLTVSGAAVNEVIMFTATMPGTYPVTFMETGLATGTSWSVTLNSAAQSSTGSSITFTEVNGTYSYAVGAVPGYTASPSSGTMMVSGASRSVSITFTATTSAVQVQGALVYQPSGKNYSEPQQSDTGILHAQDGSNYPVALGSTISSHAA